MLQAAKEFRVGRPQILAGLMLLGFLAQCLWAAAGRKLSDLEYSYIASGVTENRHPEQGIHSPMTAWVAALPVRATRMARTAGPAGLSAYLAVPRPWIMRLPFVVFGVWLGGALWWVARRLFDDSGGYIALGLYCSSPAMVMISSNVGPEIILAWSIFGMVYTSVGVAHTLYAPPKKWIPRIVILGLAIGFAVSTALWALVVVLLALALMIYLGPGRRSAVFAVMLSACSIASLVTLFFFWSMGWGPGSAWVSPKPTLAVAQNLGFVFADGELLVVFSIAAITAYGSWPRTRYFGNTAPLLTAFSVVLLFALVPSLYIWYSVLGLCFIFLFIAGVAADFLETPFRRPIAALLLAGLLLRIVLGLRTLWVHWVGQNGV
jgi:hypothetical protein